MNMTRDDLEERLGRLPRPELPDDLRQNVLGAAVFAAAPDWRDRVWFSRRWRLATAALVLAVLLLDQRAGRPPGAGSDLQPSASRPTALEAASLAERTGVPVESVQQLLARIEIVPLTAPDPVASAAGMQ